MTGIPRAALLAALLFVAGCGGPQQAEVSGHITLDGVPLPGGQVRFVPKPETPGPEFSAQIVNGDYRVAKGVLPGEYVVQIRFWKETGRVTKDLHGNMTAEMVNGIPARYRDSTNELIADLQPGANTANFDLLP